MSTIPYSPTVSNKIDWDSPRWGEAGQNVHTSSTGSEMEAEQ